MKTYIAIPKTLEMLVAEKLAECVYELSQRLLNEEFVRVSLLSVSDRSTQFVTHFTGSEDLETVKSLLQQVFESKAEPEIYPSEDVDDGSWDPINTCPISTGEELSVGRADFGTLLYYFDSNSFKVEDGHCFIFCDRNQKFPLAFQGRLSFSFGVFTKLQMYPAFFERPDWYSLGWHDPAMTTIHSDSKEFIRRSCAELKSVNRLIVNFPNGNGFIASPFPRLPQRMLFEDSEFLHPANQTFEVHSENCSVSGLEFCTFFNDNILFTIPSSGCTYFLKPRDQAPDKESYGVFAEHLLKNCRIALFRRNVGDYFLMRPHRKEESSPLHIMLEFISTTAIKFSKSERDAPKLRFRKYIFSLDSHTTFNNRECLEMTLNRLCRTIRRETDIVTVRRDLMLMGRNMAVSCHNQFAPTLANMISDHMSEVSLELQHLYAKLVQLLNSHNGMKKMVDYLETLVPDSRTKNPLY